jgi:chorismate synthase
LNIWGTALRLSIFGESHGPAIGVVIDGLPAGERLDMDAIQHELNRRAPGGELSSARKEADRPEILSGLLDGTTTGAPLCAILQNTNARPQDYGTALRPGHADWTALLKHGGHADMRGGGHFSGRLTAPLVFAGAAAKQLLARQGVKVYGRLAAIGGIESPRADCDEAAYTAIGDGLTPQMRDAILAAKEAGDSIGGIIEAAAFGVPGGLGIPFFASVESVAAALLFSIPAVKAVEFGTGAQLAAMRGSKANDALRLSGGRIVSQTNHSGGILGGITTGMPVTVRAAIKPTPSIAMPQQTVDAATLEETTLTITGRHDPCIAPRALPAVEAALALTILDLLMAKYQ